MHENILTGSHKKNIRIRSLKCHVSHVKKRLRRYTHKLPYHGVCVSCVCDNVYYIILCTLWAIFFFNLKIKIDRSQVLMFYTYSVLNLQQGIINRILVM